METEESLEITNQKVIEILKKITPLPLNGKENDDSNEPKTNLYELIKQLALVKKTMNDPDKFFDLFEDIAVRLKKNGGIYFNEEKSQINQKDLEKILERFKIEKELIKPPVKIEPESEPQPITSINFIPDYLDLFNKLSYSGHSFTDKELLLLNSSLRNLAIAQPNGNVTFFGKIYGTKQDYYIAEVTEVDPPENFNYEADMEKRKEDGINKNVFFVTNNLCGKWIELPDVKPSQIQASRKIRYVFTGELDSEICSNPPFNGVEKHFLRCQIARIYHGTKLVPSINHYVMGEDPETPFKPLTPAEYLKPFTFDELASLKNWIHYPPGILQCGRISHLEAPEGIEPEDYKKMILAKDPFDKRIKPVIEDKKISIGPIGKIKVTPWKINQVYGDMVYINPNIKLLDEAAPDFDPKEQKDNKVNYLVVSVRSLRWPGAVNYQVGKETYFFYFGNGLKIVDDNEESYIFKDFPIIPDEYPERDEQQEPHAPPEPPKQQEEAKAPEE